MIENHPMTASAYGTDTNSVAQWFNCESDGQLQIGHSYSLTTERKLRQHEHVFLDGDTQTHIYQVLEGVVGVYKLLADGRRQIVTFCYPGDMIGLDHPERFSHHAEAMCQSRVRCIPVSALDTLIKIEPGFGRALLQVLSSELADTRDQLMSLGRKSALEKLATFLVRIARRSERCDRTDENLYLPMTRAEIADYLGLTIETVSRNFTRLRLARIIRLCSKSEVQVLDKDALESIAEGMSTGDT